MRSRRPTRSPALTGGAPQLPFFLDGNARLHRRDRVRSARRAVGFAGRIAVNASLLADPSRLVVFQTAPLTAAGDATRPNFIYDRLNSAVLSFSPQSGIGTASAPFSGSLHAFMRQVISQQGEAAEAAANLKQGQDVVFNALQQRFNDSAAVNIDEEMAQPAQPAECLRRQRARADDGQGNARRAAEDVRSP